MPPRHWYTPACACCNSARIDGVRGVAKDMSDTAVAKSCLQPLSGDVGSEWCHLHTVPDDVTEPLSDHAPVESP